MGLYFGNRRCRIRRPATVVITVVLLILGGALCAGMNALLVFAFTATQGVQAPPGADPRLIRFALFFVVAFFGALALWQWATAAGLWRLKPWGRVSLLIFSGFLVTFQGMGLLMLPFLPFDQAAPAGRSEIAFFLRIFLLVFYAVPLAVGIWWLIYFNRARGKALFSPDGVPPAESLEPASIRVIGWFLVTSALTMPLLIYWQAPAVLLGMLLTGWAAALVNAFWCAFTLYAGVELLRWKSRGYFATLALLLFGTLNAIVFWSLPGSSERMAEIMRMTNFFGLTPPENQFVPSSAFSITFSLVGLCLPGYFLLTRRKKFLAVEEARAQRKAS